MRDSGTLLNRLDDIHHDVLREAVRTIPGYWDDEGVDKEVLIRGFPKRYEEMVEQAIQDLIDIEAIEEDDGLIFTELGFNSAQRAQNQVTREPLAGIEPESEDDSLSRNGGQNEEMRAHADEIGGSFYVQNNERCNLCNHENSHFVKSGGRLLCQECFREGERF